MMRMEPISTMMLPGCYKPTVNEPETITEAQPFSAVRSRCDANQSGAGGIGHPVAPHIERS
jgi:hypothetical protein